MPYYPGAAFKVGFTSRRASTAVSYNVTGSPTAILFKNGVADGAVTLTVTQAQDATPAYITGAYFVSGTIPSVGYAAGDSIAIWVGVVVDGVSDGEFIGGFSLDSMAGMPTVAAIAAAVWDYVLEGSRTAAEIMRIILAGLIGKRSQVYGTGIVTITIRNPADTKDRIVQVVNTATGDKGNATTLDGT